jgi:hypothetical protein
MDKHYHFLCPSIKRQKKFDNIETWKECQDLGTYSQHFFVSVFTNGPKKPELHKTNLELALGQTL